MFSWDDQGLESTVFDGSYGNDMVHEVFPSQYIHARIVSTSSITPVLIPSSRLVTLSCYSVQTPFILTPH